MHEHEGRDGTVLAHLTDRAVHRGVQDLQGARAASGVDPMFLAIRLSRLLSIAALPLLVASTHSGAQDLSAGTESHASRVACDADNAGLTLPPGFCALVVADNVGIARHLAVTPNGTVYVALDPARDGSDTGGLLALRDRNGDGRADERQMFFDQGGNGVAHRFGQLFFGTSDGVLRFPLGSSEFAPGSRPASASNALSIEGNHVSKPLAVTPLASLLANVGFVPDTLPEDALHGAVGRAQGPDGSLYVSDQAGRIYRILYREQP
jgi:glucose/arabinose dehydrogenase